jgi:hypothetical protein
LLKWLYKTSIHQAQALQSISTCKMLCITTKHT